MRQLARLARGFCGALQMLPEFNELRMARALDQLCSVARAKIESRMSACLRRAKRDHIRHRRFGFSPPGAKRHIVNDEAMNYVGIGVFEIGDNVKRFDPDTVLQPLPVRATK